MTELQKRKFEKMLDRGQAATVRKALLEMPNDKDAQAMLEDMKISYPVTRLEKANDASWRILSSVGGAFALFVAVILLIAVIQLIQARLALGGA